jgi:hypothetical protein
MTLVTPFKSQNACARLFASIRVWADLGELAHYGQTRILIRFAARKGSADNHCRSNSREAADSWL